MQNDDEKISSNKTELSSDFRTFADMLLQKDGPHGNAWGLNVVSGSCSRRPRPMYLRLYESGK